MNDWQDKLAKQLDRDRPRWAVEWATGAELADFVTRSERGGFVQAQDGLRLAVSRRVFHSVLHAALGAGIVQEPAKADA